MDDAESLVKKTVIQEAKSTQKTAKDSKVFSAALQKSLDGVIISDLYGYIIDANETVLKMHGATDKTEFVGKNILSLTVKSDKERAVNDSINMIMTDQGRKSQYRGYLKNGEEIPFEVTTDFVRDENGEKIGFVHTIRNLTSEKK